MVTKVRADMRSCDRYAIITADTVEPGTVRISFDTNCDNVKQYAALLGDTLTFDDCLDFGHSKVFDPEVLKPLTMTCAIPTAVMNAVYMEFGMMSRSLADKDQSDGITFMK